MRWRDAGVVGGRFNGTNPEGHCQPQTVSGLPFFQAGIPQSASTLATVADINCFTFAGRMWLPAAFDNPLSAFFYILPGPSFSLNTGLPVFNH